MAKKAKGNRVQVILECTEQKDSGVPGISRYITTKNKKNTPDRLKESGCNLQRRQGLQEDICQMYQDGKIRPYRCLHFQGGFRSHRPYKGILREEVNNYLIF